MTVLAQTPITPTDIPWAAISPVLVLFGAGLLVLLLDTAGENRLSAAFVVFGVLTAAAVTGYLRTDQIVLPALGVLVAFVQFGLTALWGHRPRTLGAILSALGFGVALGATAWQWLDFSAPGLTFQDLPVVGTSSLLAGMFAVDGVALFTTMVICLAGLVTIPLGFSYAEERRMHRGEYYPLLLFSATGMVLLATSADLLMVFVSIEILSLSLYLLAGFAKRDLNSQESALKYFLLGAFSSALLLYGVALVYGVAGTTNIAAVGQAFATLSAPAGMVLTAMALLLVGLAFKTSLVPFHMWTPDVYQGAPTPVTGFMAAATKAAAFAAFLRVFVGAFSTLQWSWTPVIGVLAVVTMLGGAILAVVQTDLKRMLGYSAIAHGGYILIGLVTSTRAGISATLFYLLVYAFMSLGTFGVLGLLERRTRKAMTISDLRGLGRTDFVPAALFALFLLSLAGIPGTAGFYAKFAVVRAAVDPAVGQYGLAVVLVLSSVIAAFFYVRVIVAMFVEAPSEDAPPPLELESTKGVSFGLAVSAAVVIALGIVPGDIVDLARQAASFAR